MANGRFHLSNEDTTKDDNYQHYKKKYDETKLQMPMDLEDANILWSITTSNPPNIGYLPYLLMMNRLKNSHKTISLISHVHGYFSSLESELSEHGSRMQSDYEILNEFNIGTIMKSDEIYHTKDYQKSLFQLTRSVKIVEAIEIIRETRQASVEIDRLRTSDLMSILLTMNNILYLNITHVLIGEQEVSLYEFISCLLSKEYDKTLKILVIPIFPDLHDTNSSVIEINEIVLNATEDQTRDQLYKLKPRRRTIIRNYLKAMTDVLYSSGEKYSSTDDISEIINHMKNTVLSSSKSSVYVAGSFLTDQFHVLRKHWRKNIHKDEKCTGTGHGIDGLQANEQGYEPPLGGKFVIINWTSKEIVYTLDLDAPAGFFIENSSLYIANNRLNYISIIDLISRVEVKRIENSAFNCLHSIHRAENETILVTSTGIDALIQINLNGETINDWYATEHGYTVTPNGEKRFIQRDFDHHHYVYPTLHQTTHINCGIVLDCDHYLATLFHQGMLVKIDRRSGKCEVLLSGLHCPHAIKRYKSNQENEIKWMLCNTKHNELLFLNEHFQIIQKMILEDVNWLQDVTQLPNEHIIITDANHSRMIEIDPNSNTVLSELFYSDNWRIYQISDLAAFQTNFIPEH